MSNLVRELFPDLPERCQECPGIETIAKNISDSLDFVTHIGGTALDIENGERSESNPEGFSRVAHTAGNMALDQLSDATNLVSKLTNACADGVLEFDVSLPAKKQRFRNRTGNSERVSLCSSLAPEALLLHSQSQIHLRLARRANKEEGM